MLILSLLILSVLPEGFGQQPSLPPTNLGLANVFDGIAGKPGFIYQGYIQLFQTRKLKGEKGEDIHSGLRVNSLLFMNQFIYLTPVQVLGGNLGFTILVPIVQIAASNKAGMPPIVSPSVVGDVIEGTAIQWSDKKILGLPFSHRMELDLTIPVGNYNEKYDINPSAHAFAFGLYHAFTLKLSGRFSLSARNQVNYNSRYVSKKDKAGAYYNGNYSADFALLPNLRMEAAAYFLTQFIQDSYAGDKSYYRRQWGIDNTKERVAAFGPGIVYFSRGGTFFEIKAFFETAAKNRFEGFRPTFRIAVPF